MRMPKYIYSRLALTTSFLLVTGYGLAYAWTTLNPIDAGSGKPLTAALMQGIVNNINELNIATQSGLSLRAPIASPALTGIPTSVTPLDTDSGSMIATKAYVDVKTASGLSLRAPLASPALTGIPTSVTPLDTDSGSMIATKAYVDLKTASAAGGSYFGCYTNVIASNTWATCIAGYTKVYSANAYYATNTAPTYESGYMPSPVGNFSLGGTLTLAIKASTGTPSYTSVYINGTDLYPNWLYSTFGVLNYGVALCCK